MARSFVNIKFDGIDQLKKFAEAFSKEGPQIVDDELNATAIKIQTLAKQKAPVNDGLLRQGIDINSQMLSKEVNVLASYAPYIEFGTGSKVSIPAEWADFAAQFKGKTGATWQEFLRSLTIWVRKKGLAGTYSVKTQKRTGSKAARADQDKQVAYAIMRSILAKGIKPHPFLYPAFKEATTGVEDKIAKRLQDELNG